MTWFDVRNGLKSRFAPPHSFKIVSDNQTNNSVVIGIAGGGQLGQMMIEASTQLGLSVIAMDPNPKCSAADLAQSLVVADFTDAEGIAALGLQSDVVTFEIERINVDALAALEQKGVPVRPSSNVLRIIQDKLAQKQFLLENNVATSAFQPLDEITDLPSRVPFVWKARRDGYDGRGVQIVREAQQLSQLPETAALVEDLVDIDYELAIMVARGVDGDIRFFPLTEIVMDPKAHVMQRVIAPARVPESVEKDCLSLAKTVVEALDYVGVLALEYFVDRSEKVFVNELSPRPHNSGHYTIEACKTSQFEQHMRAVAGMPLGDTTLAAAAVTFNVLGEPNANGTPCYVGFDGGTDRVFVHNYFKTEVRPGRKMAHVTVLADNRQEAIALADEVQPNFRVDGDQ